MLLQYATFQVPHNLICTVGKLLLWSENAFLDVTWMSESEPDNAGFDTNPNAESVLYQVK